MVHVGSPAESVESTQAASEPESNGQGSPAVTRKPKSKKAGKKPAAGKGKKAAKKGGKKGSKPAIERKPRAKKEGLRRFQERALKALRGGRLTMESLEKRAGIKAVVLRRGIGPVDSSLLKKHDGEMGFPCLQTLGMVKVDIDEGTNGKETYYVLTAKGKAAAEKIDKLPPKHPAPGEVAKKRK